MFRRNSTHWAMSWARRASFLVMWAIARLWSKAQSLAAGAMPTSTEPRTLVCTPAGSSAGAAAALAAASTGFGVAFIVVKYGDRKNAISVPIRKFYVLRFQVLDCLRLWFCVPIRIFHRFGRVSRFFSARYGHAVTKRYHFCGRDLLSSQPAQGSRENAGSRAPENRPRFFSNRGNFRD